MKLTPIPCPHLKNAKRIIRSDRNFLVLTGRAVIILDHELNHIKTIEGLKYAYNGHISPDGTKLFVISNQPEFYMISLETLEMVYRCHLKGQVTTMEGQGCWSLDGKYVMLPVMDKQTYTWALRIYDATVPERYVDDTAPSADFWFYTVLPISKEGAVYLLVRTRDGERSEQKINHLCLLRYDSAWSGRYDIPHQDGTPFSMEYREDANRLVIYTFENTFTCDTHGGHVREIDTGHGADERSHMLFKMPFTVKQITASMNGKYLYMASNVGLDIFDRATGELRYSKELTYGAEHVMEIEDGLIAVSLYGGSSKLYRIQNQKM